MLRNSGFLKLSLRVMLSSLSEHFSKKDTFSFAYGHALDDTLLLASDFHFASFSNVKRLGNSVAHCLAKKAKFNY